MVKKLNPTELSLVELHGCSHWVSQTECWIFYIFCSYITDMVLQMRRDYN